MVCLVLIFFGVANGVGVAQEEWMPDPILREAIREAIGLPAAAPLAKENMLGFEFLSVDNKGISDITSLEYVMNLKELHISRNPITDLRPLASLTQLRELHF